MANQFAYDVFLSYNQADRVKVLRLAQRLKDAGVRVWLDNWIVKPGDIITLKMDQGLEQSRVLLLCMSPAAFGSDWVALERHTIIYKDPTNEERRFVPLLLTDCTLPDTLRRYKYIDYREESEEMFEEVLSSCRPEAEAIIPQPALPQKSNPEPAKVAEAEPLATLERELKHHKDWIHCVAVSPDGTWMASASGDKTIKMWDMETGDCETTLQGHIDKVNTLAITPDGKTILSGSFDNTIRVWDVGTLQSVAMLEASKHVVMDIAITPDSQRAISCGAAQDPHFKIWDIKHYQCIGGFENPFGLQYAIAIYDNGKRLVSGGEDGDIYLWDLVSQKALGYIKGHTKAIRSVQVTRDSRLAITGSDDKTIKIWDLEKKICIGTLEGHQHSIYSIAISSDGNLIASTGFLDKTVRLWDLASGASLQVIKNLENAPISIVFSPNNLQLVVGTAAGPMYMYHLTGFRSAAWMEDARRYVNAKVVLLGEGTVGKTSLAHRLIEDEYVIKDRTHGMNVWRLELPSQKDDTVENEALLWDLAGQEDYRLIHRLFLDQTSLALLLVNPQRQDPFEEAGEWLKILQTVSKHPIPCLLIFSQVDVGGMKLSNAKIDRFKEQFGFIAWLPTSAKTGENCSDITNKGNPSRLKQLIADSIPWGKLPWTSTPRLLTDLKNAVMLMRDESDIRLLRFAELAQRLEQSLPGKMFTTADIRTAVALLANHGLVRPLPFGDLVLLRPDLINGYAAAVIRAARAHTDEIGCVAEASIYQPDFDFTGVDRLQQSDEELLLRALVQTFLDHSLCIAEETPTGRQLVFPSQYRREKDIPNHPEIFVSYTFGGEWQTIWTTLVVRLWYSHEFGQKELWRNAAEFETSKGQRLGLLAQKESDGAATISLYFDMAVSDDLKIIFIEYVHRHLAKYACDVVRDRRYVCAQCAQPVIDLTIVRQRKEAGKDFIICQRCDEKVFFHDFIEQRLKSDPVAQKILAMETAANQQLDAQALEQILIGHMMAIAEEANQIFRPVTFFDYGIDGEIEFKDNNGKASGKKIYVQLKSDDTYLRSRKSDDSGLFDVSNDQHLHDWVSQPVDVYLVIRQKDKDTDEFVIRWMNITEYLKNRKDKESRQLIFEGEDLDMKALYQVRDTFFPAVQYKA